MRKVNGMLLSCYLVKKTDFGQEELYVAKKNVRFEEEGSEEAIFLSKRTDRGTAEARSVMVEGGKREFGVDDEIFLGLDDDSILSGHDLLIHQQISLFKSLGIPVGEEDPEEEVGGGTTSNVKIVGWYHSSVDPRRTAGIPNRNPKFKEVGREVVRSFSYLSTFLLLFPVDYIWEVVVPNCNLELSLPTSVGELFHLVGAIFFMSCFQGHQHHEWFSHKEVSIDVRAPFRLNSYISVRRMAELILTLNYTSNNRTVAGDQFHPVRMLIQECNTHMWHTFHCGWVACLDESMPIWMNQLTCPGWMVMPRKPHPFGNEYITICCGLCGVLFHMEMVEGRHRPTSMPPLEYSEMGKTASLLLCMKKPIWNSGTVLVLDSGFCVLKAFADLVDCGIYAGSLIKKRCYWPKGVPGDSIGAHMKGKEVGDVDSLHLTVDGTQCHVYVMKYTDYCNDYV